jgi:hypothetical protein
MSLYGKRIIASNKQIFMPSEQEIWMMPKMFVAPPKVDSPYCCPVVLYCEEGEVSFSAKLVFERLTLLQDKSMIVRVR